MPVVVRGRKADHPRGPGGTRVFAVMKRSDWFGFGIESSYSQMNQARGRTSTRRPELRLLYAGIAPVLRNEWVWLHFRSCRRRGGAAV